MELCVRTKYMGNTMDECIMCTHVNIQLVRQHGYISEATKSVKLFRCHSCKEYFITVESYFVLLHSQDPVGCIYFMHLLNRTQGQKWFRIVITV